MVLIIASAGTAHIWLQTRENHLRASHQSGKMAVSNVVYIGKKPFMNYYLAVMSALEKSDGSVKLKARGQAISTALVVAEIIRN